MISIQCVAWCPICPTNLSRVSVITIMPHFNDTGHPLFTKKHRTARCACDAMGCVAMMTSSNEKNSRVAGPFCVEFTGHGEFPSQRPVTRSFDVFFDPRLNKWLSKQSWGWWFETSSCPLWRHCNDRNHLFTSVIQAPPRIDNGVTGHYDVTWVTWVYFVI